MLPEAIKETMNGDGVTGDVGVGGGEREEESDAWDGGFDGGLGGRAGG